MLFSRCIVFNENIFIFDNEWNEWMNENDTYSKWQHCKDGHDTHINALNNVYLYVQTVLSTVERLYFI